MKRITFCLKSALIIASFCLLAISGSAFANGFYVQASGGAGVSRLGGETDNVTVAPGIVDQYAGNKTSKFVPAGGVGLGYQFRLSNQFDLALGLAGYYMYLNKTKGVRHPMFNVNPNFDTLNYNYKLQSFVVMAEGRLIFHPFWSTTWQNIQPYLLLGVGATRNRATDYSEVPTNPSGSAAPSLVPLANKSKTRLAYEVGLGVQHPISTSSNISLEYRFMGLGKGEIGSGPSLETGNIYANMVFLNWMYYFGATSQ